MPVLYKRGLLESTRVTMISPDYISPNPDQPRRYFDPDGMAELADSIRVHGILQPLTVRRKGGGRYELIAGERRLRAAMICGLTEVPCLVMDVDRENSCLLSLIENLQRRDLDFWEEAKALERLIQVYGLSQEEAAAKVGKSQSAVANKLRLLRLPEQALELLRKNGFTERHARALLRLPGGGPGGQGGLDGLPHGAVCGGGPQGRGKGAQDPASPVYPGRALLPEHRGPRAHGDALGRGGRQVPPGGGRRRHPVDHPHPQNQNRRRQPLKHPDFSLHFPFFLFSWMFHVKHPFFSLLILVLDKKLSMLFIAQSASRTV